MHHGKRVGPCPFSSEPFLKRLRTATTQHGRLTSAVNNSGVPVTVTEVISYPPLPTTQVHFGGEWITSCQNEDAVLLPVFTKTDFLSFEVCDEEAKQFKKCLDLVTFAPLYLLS